MVKCSYSLNCDELPAEMRSGRPPSWLRRCTAVVQWCGGPWRCIVTPGHGTSAALTPSRAVHSLSVPDVGVSRPIWSLRIRRLDDSRTRCSSPEHTKHISFFFDPRKMQRNRDSETASARPERERKGVYQSVYLFIYLHNLFIFFI